MDATCTTRSKTKSREARRFSAIADGLWFVGLGMVCVCAFTGLGSLGASKAAVEYLLLPGLFMYAIARVAKVRQRL
jgi:hypothetical protein